MAGLLVCRDTTFSEFRRWVTTATTAAASTGTMSEHSYQEDDRCYNCHWSILLVLQYPLDDDGRRRPRRQLQQFDRDLRLCSKDRRLWKIRFLKLHRSSTDPCIPERQNPGPLDPKPSNPKLQTLQILKPSCPSEVEVGAKAALRLFVRPFLPELRARRSQLVVEG